MTGSFTLIYILIGCILERTIDILKDVPRVDDSFLF